MIFNTTTLMIYTCATNHMRPIVIIITNDGKKLVAKSYIKRIKRIPQRNLRKSGSFPHFIRYTIYPTYHNAKSKLIAMKALLSPCVVNKRPTKSEVGYHVVINMTGHMPVY